MAQRTLAEFSGHVRDILAGMFGKKVEHLICVDSAAARTYVFVPSDDSIEILRIRFAEHAPIYVDLEVVNAESELNVRALRAAYELSAVEGVRGLVHYLKIGKPSMRALLGSAQASQP